MTVDHKDVEEVKPTGGTVRWKTLAVLMSVACVLTVTAFTFTIIYMQSSHSQVVKDVLSFKDYNGMEATEMVEKNDAAHTTKFTVTGKNGTITLFMDFKKKLSVMKRSNVKDPYCAVYFINTTTHTDAIMPTGDNNKREQEQQAGHSVWLEKDSEAIDDISFLPIDAQDMCDGLPVYWASQKYGQQHTNADGLGEEISGERMKRAVRCYHTWCYVGSYWDSQGRVDVYQYCGITCINV